MDICLGIYIEDNLIKYAKVSKDKEKIKVESFGIKFYENLSEAIQQIVEETGSDKIPISINLSGEKYAYFDMFSMLNSKDLDKAIKTEFEMYCSERSYNPNVFETRYVISKKPNEKEKIKIIHISADKVELTKKSQALEGKKLASIVPLAMTIPNLIETRPKENCLIVNIEDSTTVTTILDENISEITTIEEGTKDFLNRINLKENSYSKAYEICKNTTIYTSETQGLPEDEIGYLEEIMPVLYQIVGKVMKVINETEQKIDKVYLTGTAVLINNIDLYFQEYLTDVKCEILKPYFVKSTKDISLQDYIEVNSAISLALAGVGQVIAGINFRKENINDKLPSWLKLETSSGNKKGQTKPKTQKEKKGSLPEIKMLKNDLGEKLDKLEISLLRTATGFVILLIVYTCFSVLIEKQINQKTEEANQSISTTNAQIQLAENDKTKLDAKTNDYTEMIQNLQELNDKITDANKSRDAIPNLLNQIMFIIPENVQITSIQNTTGRHIVIEAQSNKYEQLGMFKAKLDTEMYLTNVISTSGQQENKVIKVKIEGDLP